VKISTEGIEKFFSESAARKRKFLLVSFIFLFLGIIGMLFYSM
jgi:hypothetical protein